jgi:type I restriction enzyme, S subunit
MNTRTVSFGSIAEFRNGINYVAADAGDTVKVVGVGDFRDRSRLSQFGDLATVTIGGALAADDELRDGDLLLVRSNGSKDLVGRSLIIDKPPPGLTFSGFTIRARVDRSEALPEFVAVVIQGDAIKNRLLMSGGGNGNIANLSQTLLRDIELPLPPLDTQRMILGVASVWDSATEKAVRLIAAKQRRLNHIRTRLFHSRGSKDWVAVKLNEVLHEHGVLSDGTAPVYSVSVHKGLVNQIEHLGRSFAASDTSKYNLVHPGDVVYTKSPTGDFPYGVVKQSHANRDAIVSPLYGVFSPSSADIGLLIDFFFESPIQSRNYLRPLIQKGAKNTIAITNDGFLAGTLRLPRSKSAERDAAALVRDAKREIAILTDEVAALRRQRWGLMQRLLTGEWRVPIDEGVTA